MMWSSLTVWNRQIYVYCYLETNKHERKPLCISQIDNALSVLCHGRGNRNGNYI